LDQFNFFGVGDAPDHRKFGHDTRGGICMQPPHEKIVEKFIQKNREILKADQLKSCFQHVI